ncbi:hypothetical protein FQZ97_795320 [compost metagenome]
MFCSVAARSLRSAPWRDSKSCFCTASVVATRGSLPLAWMSGGNTRLGRPSRSASSRASVMRAARNWMRVISALARACTLFMRTSACPAVTVSPSFTKISSTVPPVRCCTAFLLPATVTVPPMGTPLSSGAKNAQIRKLPRPTSTSHQPRRAWELASVLTGFSSSCRMVASVTAKASVVILCSLWKRSGLLQRVQAVSPAVGAVGAVGAGWSVDGSVEGAAAGAREAAAPGVAGRGSAAPLAPCWAC